MPYPWIQNRLLKCGYIWKQKFLLDFQGPYSADVHFLPAQNILVIKTVSGMAMAVAAALDAIKFHEVVGCIAGDDTIMCAVRSVDDTIIVMEKIKKMVED